MVLNENTTQLTRVHEESPGVKSSKRYYGALLVVVGGLVLTLTGTIAIFYKVVDPETAIVAGRILVITGSALLGVGILDGVGAAIVQHRVPPEYEVEGK
jgi:hypothetical protein